MSTPEVTYPNLGSQLVLHPVEVDKKVDPAWTEDPSYKGACGELPLLRLPKTLPKSWSVSLPYISLAPSYLPAMPKWVPFPKMDDVQKASASPEEMDRRHFWNLLVAVTPQTSFKFSVKNTKPVRILDVACGDGLDAIPLHSYFGRRSFSSQGQNVTYLGIDIESK